MFGGGLVEGVAVVESLREGVDAAQREAVAEAAAKVDLQRVVGADAFGEPRPGVGDVRDWLFCAGGNVEVPAGTGAPASGEPTRKPRLGSLVGLVGELGSKLGKRRGTETPGR